MIAVIFEVFPAGGRKGDYLEYAARLKTELACMDGFISVERFQSLTDPDKLLSLSFWRDEEAVAGWRSRAGHRAAQSAGRAGVVAVGTEIALRPPHRSRRALLTHRAPTLDGDEEPFGSMLERPRTRPPKPQAKKRNTP
jgi:heme-degrading monooxygenase HmoA